MEKTPEATTVKVVAASVLKAGAATRAGGMPKASATSTAGFVTSKAAAAGQNGAPG
jgi:hypothetical protein